MYELFQNNELKDAGHILADHMASSYFTGNANGKMQLLDLPAEVQYAPVNTIDQLDFNLDGIMELLLCGNNSGSKIRLGKMDGNFGILLKGEKDGRFTYVKQDKSGLRITGDVRSTVMVNDRIYFGINGKEIISYSVNKRKE